METGEEEGAGRSLFKAPRRSRENSASKSNPMRETHNGNIAMTPVWNRRQSAARISRSDLPPPFPFRSPKATLIHLKPPKFRLARPLRR